MHGPQSPSSTLRTHLSWTSLQEGANTGQRRKAAGGGFTSRHLLPADPERAVTFLQVSEWSVKLQC